MAGTQERNVDCIQKEPEGMNTLEMHCQACVKFIKN